MASLPDNAPEASITIPLAFLDGSIVPFVATIICIKQKFGKPEEFKPFLRRAPPNFVGVEDGHLPARH